MALVSPFQGHVACRNLPLTGPHYTSHTKFNVFRLFFRGILGSLNIRTYEKNGILVQLFPGHKNLYCRVIRIPKLRNFYQEYSIQSGICKPVMRNQRPRGLFLESPEKPFVKLRPAYSVKLVFSYVVKGIKIKRTAKFRASRRLRFEDTKRIMSPEMLPKSYGTFEKRAPDQA